MTQLFQHPTRPHALYESANPNEFRYGLSGNLSTRNGQTLTYDEAGRPGYEIKNRVRSVKTIRAEGMIVAQVSGMLPPQGAAAPWLRGAPADPAPIAFTLAGLALLGVLAGAARRNELWCCGRSRARSR